MTESFTFEKVAPGQEFSFEKAPESCKLEKVCFGLGWSPRRGGSVDLDASIIQTDASGAVIDIIYFSNKNSKDGAISHSGDDLTGQNSKDGDDEVITIDMTKLNPATKSLYTTVTAYSGQTLADVKDAYCRMFDNSNGTETELCRSELSSNVATTGIVAAKLYMNNGEWAYKAIDKAAMAKHAGELKDIVSQY